ncbi:MAG TPA: TetR/AcrR family transcriptional regulator, partial [Nevskiaceae bacterium]|nr:TetR/AcrR family transcriptional regulator [Nevskiaceae bacterium]
MSTPSPSTSERIVETALKLFNEHGYSNVASLRIAMALGISPGHLAYHFKSKTDLVLAVFPHLEEELGRDLVGVTQPRRPFTAEEAALHQIELFRILWKYRFIFNALTQLMQDRDIHRRFMALQDTAISATAAMFDDLIAQGYMRPIRPPNSTRIMARNQWMIWLSWLRFEHIEHPERETARNAAVHEGLVQGFCNIQPYFDDAFAAEMLA